MYISLRCTATVRITNSIKVKRISLCFNCDFQSICMSPNRTVIYIRHWFVLIRSIFIYYSCIPFLTSVQLMALHSGTFVNYTHFPCTSVTSIAQLEHLLIYGSVHFFDRPVSLLVSIQNSEFHSNKLKYIVFNVLRAPIKRKCPTLPQRDYWPRMTHFFLSKSAQSSSHENVMRKAHLFISRKWQYTNF